MSTTLNNILGGGRKATATPAATGAAPGGTGTTTQRQAVPQIDWGTGRVDTGRTNAQAPLAPGASGNGETKTTAQTPRRLTYEEMFMLSNPDPTPTPEQLEKERRKQKRDKIFAAIGDGISALSNLYFTTKGAPSMYSGRETASRRVNDRWAKLAADRDAKMKAYIDGLMRARQADDAYNANEREWQRQLGLDKIKQERDKAADARAEAEEKRDQEMHDLNKQLMDNKITQAEYDAKVAEVKAKYAPQLEESNIRKNKASEAASWSRARYYDRGGSGGSKSKDLQEAYDYWMSLTDEQKKQYRDWNNRYRRIKTGTDDYDNPIYTNQYMDDDDDFIQMVWKQRQGFLNNPDNVTMPGVSGNTMPGVK